MKATNVKPIAIALCTALTGGLALSSTAFALEPLPGGYMISEQTEGKCGEGKCGEGKCGAEADKKKDAEGKCGEGKCGEGKCGAEADKKKDAEGKCGEGKCGGSD